MLELSRICFLAGLVLAACAFLSSLVVLFGARRSAAPVETSERVPEMAGAGGGSGSPARVETSYTPPSALGAKPTGWALYTQWFVLIAAGLLTVGLVARTLVTGHAPFANHYEYAVSFAWGILVLYWWFERQYQTRILGIVLLPVVVGLMLYASSTGSDVQPLIPALQNHFLLTLHVITAIIAYGAAGVSFAAAVVYLVRPRLSWRFIPSRQVLDEMAYKAQVIAFPMLTLMLILGAVWGNIAWGRYWAWDPKETSALVTWLIYGAYLHARVVRGWQGSRSAWLLIIGFAAVLFTFFSSLFLGGLHAYA